MACGSCGDRVAKKIVVTPEQAEADQRQREADVSDTASESQRRALENAQA